MPVTPNFIVSGLPAYVDQNRDLLLKNFALVGGGTRERISIQTGVKGKAAINFLDVAPTLQDGSVCNIDAAGSATLTQRVIETAMISVRLDICWKTVVGKYAEYLVRINANAENTPFEAYVVDGLTRELSKKIEKLIWQGDTDSASTDLKWIDGFLAIAGDEAAVVDVEIASGKSAYEGIQAVYFAMTEETLERGGEIYVSPAIFRAFMQEMVARNYYHYAPGNDELREFLLPGSDCKVVRTQGLAGSLYILGTFPANLFYGCDMENDEEVIKVKYDDISDNFIVKALWNSGVQIAFPDQVVLGVFAAAPTPQVSNADALGTIATKQTAIASDLGSIKTAVEAIDDLAGAYDSENTAIKTKEVA